MLTFQRSDHLEGHNAYYCVGKLLHSTASRILFYSASHSVTFVDFRPSRGILVTCSVTCVRLRARASVYGDLLDPLKRAPLVPPPTVAPPNFKCRMYAERDKHLVNVWFLSVMRWPLNQTHRTKRRQENLLRIVGDRWLYDSLLASETGVALFITITS